MSDAVQDAIRRAVDDASDFTLTTEFMEASQEEIHGEFSAIIREHIGPVVESLEKRIADLERQLATYGPYVDHMWTCPRRDKRMSRRVQLGVVEFHSDSLNPGLRERFNAVTDDLTDAACIVDLWLLDISRVLREFGYDMRIYRTPEKQAAIDAAREKGGA